MEKSLFEKAVDWGRRKSPWIIHFNAGACNGCDIEVVDALTPHFDLERFGMLQKGTPRHADVLVVTGAVTLQTRDRLKQIYEQMVNVLENYTLAAYPQVQEIKDKLARETQAEKLLMTGSGPTVFAFYADTEKARAACALMRSAGLESYWARTL